MELTKEEILESLKENKEKLKNFGAKRIEIFGSFARGEAKESSDIDFIVEFEEGKKNFDNFMGLVFFLENLLGKKVDLLTPEGISPYIKPYIKREVIYERM